MYFILILLLKPDSNFLSSTFHDTEKTYIQVDFRYCVRGLPFLSLLNNEWGGSYKQISTSET